MPKITNELGWLDNDAQRDFCKPDDPQGKLAQLYVGFELKGQLLTANSAYLDWDITIILIVVNRVQQKWKLYFIPAGKLAYS